MGNDVLKKITDYLASHPYLNLATVCPDNTPLAHTVGFASEGATVYFVTDRNSRKAKNITHNPSVAYTIDEDCTDLAKIQGVQMKGSAEPVSDKEVVGKILEMMNKKYPYMADLPQNPDYVFFKIEPIEAQFIDNTIEFGHRDSLTF
jgi:general stress protein 26